MKTAWWWVIGGLAAIQAPYWVMIFERALSAA
jgi:hypothetical protein